ncbi:MULTISPECIES: NYN domain-containing protein [unclassified Corynebacterium]|uniref:NYN domain-containing protein n=1 Tax=unclassified Corynebacterium TaxID=2624378 RepID=UPI0029CA3F9E|nr:MULTISPECIES: NYN domain-containing protein [unclassified Corynebacterium]WPF66084.1 NYN domain-containing protein [Corynebacterium sp. 22KM0430]WPF68576.1 NYN domain-containing protein [Corynebacterium sp. 21KM1197]
MLERTLVFVDTSYLLASFYNSWETGARAQLEIDLPEVVGVLGGMIENQLHQPIHRQLWYDGIPETGPHRYQRALRSCNGVQLRAGQLIAWGERRTQKAVDTRLVADMVIAAVHQRCTDIVLVSGDADMIPGVQEATAVGIRVHLYGFGWDSMSSALRYACDTTTILDPREDFSDSMRLQVLEGPLPPSVPTKPLGETEPPEEPGPTLVPEAATQGHRPPSTPTAADSAERPEPHCPEDTEDATEGLIGTPTPAKPESADPGASEAEAVAPETPAPATKREEPADAPSTPNEVEPQAEEPAPAAATTPSVAPTPREYAERPKPTPAPSAPPKPAPKPSMMAPKRKLRSRYVPLPNEVWASAGNQTPYDVGQQYAAWWYENAASTEQRDQAHLLSGGGLPPEVDRPLLQFACETLHEYTLSESQRVNLRDGFHSGIRGVLINIRRD